MAFHATKNLGLAICEYRPCLLNIHIEQGQKRPLDTPKRKREKERERKKGRRRNIEREGEIRERERYI